MMAEKATAVLTYSDVRAAIVATDYQHWLAGEKARCWPTLNPAERSGFQTWVAGVRTYISPGQTVADMGAAARAHVEFGLALLDRYELAEGEAIFASDFREHVRDDLTGRLEHRFFAELYPDAERVSMVMSVQVTPEFTGRDGKRDVARGSYHDYWLRPYWLRRKVAAEVMRVAAAVETARREQVTLRVLPYSPTQPPPMGEGISAASPISGEGTLRAVQVSETEWRCLSSSRPGQVHRIVLEGRGWVCDCTAGGWKRSCWHVKSVLRQLAERAGVLSVADWADTLVPATEAVEWERFAGRVNERALAAGLIDSVTWRELLAHADKVATWFVEEVTARLWDVQEQLERYEEARGRGEALADDGYHKLLAEFNALASRLPYAAPFPAGLCRGVECRIPGCDGRDTSSYAEYVGMFHEPNPQVDNVAEAVRQLVRIDADVARLLAEYAPVAAAGGTEGAEDSAVAAARTRPKGGAG